MGSEMLGGGKGSFWSPRSQAQAVVAGLRAGVRLLIFRDLQPWPGAQKALINQQHHRGEPGSMALWLGHPWPLPAQGHLVASSFPRVAAELEAGLLAWGWGKTEK